MKPHVVIIDPAVKVAETECFNLIALRSPLPCSYHLPAMFGTSSLAVEDMSAVRGIVILGSATSVYDRLPWQEALEHWLKPHLLRRVPTLGICYGHQMLAHMFGGKVDYVHADQRKLVGLREIEFAATPWGPAARGKVVVSHNETVATLPPVMGIFGKSPEIPTDGLAHVDLPIWTLQSHPEATPGFLASRAISVGDVCQALAFGHGMVQRFLDFAAKSAR